MAVYSYIIYRDDSTELVPVAFNASLDEDSDATFQCLIRVEDQALSFIWEIDEQNPLVGNIQTERGVMINIAEDFRSSNLTIRKSLNNDNTTIQCTAIIGDVTTKSCLGLLRVQG